MCNASHKMCYTSVTTPIRHGAPVKHLAVGAEVFIVAADLQILWAASTVLTSMFRGTEREHVSSGLDDMLKM